MGVCNVWFSSTDNVPVLCGHNAALQYLLWLPVVFALLFWLTRSPAKRES
jgi:hypothetical protein